MSDLSFKTLVALIVYTLALVVAVAATGMLGVATYHVIKFYSAFGWDRLRHVPTNYFVYTGKSSRSPHSLQRGIFGALMTMSLLTLVVELLDYEPLVYLLLAWCYHSVVNISRVALVQPVGIYLASSNPRSNTMASLLAELHGFHFCSYLNQQGVEGSPQGYLNWASHRRFDINTEWEWYVSKIVRYLPIVVVDLRRISTFLSTEVEMLVNLEREGGTLGAGFLQRQTLVVISEPEDQDKMHIMSRLRDASAEKGSGFFQFTELEFYRFIQQRFGFRSLDNEVEFKAFIRSIPLG